MIKMRDTAMLRRHHPPPSAKGFNHMPTESYLFKVLCEVESKVTHFVLWWSAWD